MVCFLTDGDFDTAGLWEKWARSESGVGLRGQKCRNKGRKDVKFAVGDYVMVWSPLRVLKTQSKLLPNWVGPFRVEEKRAGKRYGVRHVDTGKPGECAVERLSPAALEWEPGEYDRRYKEGLKFAKTIVKDLEEGDFALFATEFGRYPAGEGEQCESVRGWGNTRF